MNNSVKMNHYNTIHYSIIMESYLYDIGYLSPLEFSSLAEKYNDCIELQSYCLDDVIELWKKDHYIIIRNVCYYDEKDQYYILSDHELSDLKYSTKIQLINENDPLYSLYYYLFEWRMSHMLLKKEKEFYDIAVQNGHPCHYELMWTWMDEHPYNSGIFIKMKQKMMTEIHRCYQPGGKGFYWSKYNYLQKTTESI